MLRNRIAKTIVRVDPALLQTKSSTVYGSVRQHDLLGLKLRDALVRTRVGLINAVRFTLKSLGHSLRNAASESFHKNVDRYPRRLLRQWCNRRSPSSRK